MSAEDLYYNLIWADQEENGDYNLMNPKGLIDMPLEKAIGSLNWTRKTLGKDKLCFIYCPEVISIFNEDGSVYNEMVYDLIKCSSKLK